MRLRNQPRAAASAPAAMEFVPARNEHLNLPQTQVKQNRRELYQGRKGTGCRNDSGLQGQAADEESRCWQDMGLNANIWQGRSDTARSCSYQTRGVDICTLAVKESVGHVRFNHSDRLPHGPTQKRYQGRLSN